MFLICITHALARSPDGKFRNLAPSGRHEVVRAAKQFEQDRDGLCCITDQHLHIDAVVTSPEARCVETVLVFADELREHTVTSQVEIDRRLMQPINADALEKVATHPAVEGAKAVVVGLHNDLVVALPDPNVIAHKYRADNPNYFKQGPVVAVIMHALPWNNAKVIYCRGLLPKAASPQSDTTWQDLLAG
jgi:phosphohistidine phosphatase SixA